VRRRGNATMKMKTPPRRAGFRVTGEALDQKV
jgi:hypothetical protein